DATGKVVAVAKDGSSFTIETPANERDGEPKRIEIKIGPKTTIVYNGVSTNGAKPTEGYIAAVILADGVASSVVFNGPAGGRGRGPSNALTGTVAAIAPKDMGFTLEMSPRSRTEA